LGLIHGHYKDKSSDANFGIAMVFPAEKIYETLFQPKLMELREQIISAWRKKHSKSQ
jgi:hypothetical protein